MYLAIDLGETTKVIEDKLKEVLVWKDIEDVENTLSYDNLKEFWNKSKSKIYELLNKA